jgi:hypothetical protein
LGSSRLFPTGWIVVTPLVQQPSATHAQICVGKTTTMIRGGLFSPLYQETVNGYGK